MEYPYALVEKRRNDNEKVIRRSLLFLDTAASGWAEHHGPIAVQGLKSLLGKWVEHHHSILSLLSFAKIHYSTRNQRNSADIFLSFSGAYE